MTTQPPPAPVRRISPEELSPEEREYGFRLKHALRCGVSGCSCADGYKVHCPSHNNAEVPTLTIRYEHGYGFSFECTRCPKRRILNALARRGLLPESHLFTSSGAQEAGLQPFNFLIQQPPDWLWPNRIPLGKLTLIAGYPSSGKTSIALDIAARVSRGAPAPDQPDTPFPAAPVVLAPLNGNPRADILPPLRLFGADLDRIYLADLLSTTLPIDYYPDEPPAEDTDEPDDAEEDDWDDEERPAPRHTSGSGRPQQLFTFEEPTVAAPRLAAPWPSLNHVMGRLANLIEAGSAALLIVDQAEDLASMHRAQPATILGMLRALAAHTGAAVIALTHNPAPGYPRAVTAMQRRLAQASVVFTTAVVEPGERRFLIPLRPAMSDDAPAIPFVLPPSDAFTVAWRKPVFPAHMKALIGPRPNDGAKTRAAQSLLVRALQDGPRPATEIEREAAMIGISRSTLVRARALCNVRAFRVSIPDGSNGAGAWYWSLPQRNPLHQDETPETPDEVVNA
ncbi:MAG: AAA family ATPase [Chloroflexi bacterium]|nr:AAA family ATPase [Chloroflexota bacterium]